MGNCSRDGLNWQTDTEKLKTKFEELGVVEEAVRKVISILLSKYWLFQMVMTDRNTGNSRGFGYVRFANEEEADRTTKEMDDVDSVEIIGACE